MSLFWKLTKINLFNTLLGTKRNNKKSMLYVYIGLFLYSMLFIGFFMFSLANTLSGSPSSLYLILILGFLISGLFVFIISFSSVSNTLYKSTDLKFLLALPISKNKIILSKMIAILVFGYVCEFIILVPTLLAYFWFAPINILSIIFAIFSFLVFPIVLICVSLFICSLFALIMPNIKHKNLLTSFFSLIFCIVFLYFYLQIDFESVFTNPSSLINNFTFVKFLPNIWWAIDSISNQNFLSIIYLIAISLVVFFITLIFVYKTYYYIKSKIESSNTSKYKINYKFKNQFFGIVKKESNQFFNCPTQVVNNCIGLVLLLIGCITLIISKLNPEQTFALPPQILVNILPFSIFIICSGIGSCNPTSISISMEKNYFSYLKCLPIKATTLINAKMFFNFILCLPFSIIASITLSILFDFTLLNIFLCVIVPISFLFLCINFGMLINLIFPKTDAVNDVVIVKQSLSSMLGILIPLFVPIILFFVISLLPNVSPTLFTILFMAFNLICGVLLFIYLQKNGNKLIKKIN